MRIFLLFMFLLFGFVNYGQAVINISNSLPLPKNEEVVEIPWKQVMQFYPNLDTTNFKVINTTSNQELQYQLEYKGKPRVQNLLVLVSIPAKGAIGLQLEKGKPKPIEPKTYARLVPERYDDFAWENDRIGFRVFGKALGLKTNEKAYGIDIFAKRTAELAINDFYKQSSYHVDQGIGLDFYRIGATLGDGNSAPYMHDSIYYSRFFIDYKMLDNGPLRTTFQLGYAPWSVNGTLVKEIKMISLDAGSQLNHIVTEYSFTNEKNELPVAIGLVKHEGKGTVLLNERNGVMGYWEPQHEKDGTLGTAVIVPSDGGIEMIVGDEHLLSIVPVISEKPLTYYAGAVWDKAGFINNADGWFNYLDQFRKKLEQPVSLYWTNF